MGLDEHAEGIADLIMQREPSLGYDALVRWEDEAQEWFARTVQNYLDIHGLMIVPKGEA